MNERLIKSVGTEIELVEQRIAFIEKLVAAGTASRDSAELLQLRRDLLSLQQKLEELWVGSKC